MKLAKGGADFIFKNPQHPPSLKVSPRISATLILDFGKMLVLKQLIPLFLIIYFLRSYNQNFKEQTIRGHAFHFIKIPSKQLEISLPMFFAVQTE